MDIISEKRALMNYNEKHRDITLMFTYKDYERGQVDPGLLGIRIGKRVMYADILSNQENRYLMGVIIKMLRGHYFEESDRTHNAIVDELISLGFHLYGISNIRQRPNSFIWDFDTTYPNKLVGPNFHRMDTYLGTVAGYLKRSRYKVSLQDVKEFNRSSFERQTLVPDDFNYQQSIIPVTHGDLRRVMFNFGGQLWLTNVPYELELTERYVKFFEAVEIMVQRLQERHSNENVYHRIFASLNILRVNNIEIRPAIITKLADDTFVLNHRPYLHSDRSLSKEHYLNMADMIDKLSKLSNEVVYDRTKC